MKRRIFIGLGLLLVIFLAGSTIAVFFITRTTTRMERLILLHQVEIQRENLIIHLQQVQAGIYPRGGGGRERRSGEMDLLIAHVQEMDKAMNGCLGCHHAPELAQGLLGMRDLADDYKTAISRLLTFSADVQRMEQLRQRALDIGQELIGLAQGMAFTANVRLERKTEETLASIRKITGVLYGMLALGILLAVIAASHLARSLDRPVRRLLDATRRISRGELHERIDVHELEGREFQELGESFNTMTRNLHLFRRQLVQSTKLAAIGELAANIAYEVNNPLTGVLGYTGLLLKGEDLTAEQREYLKTIERETLRAREILKNLLEFSRRKPPRLARARLCDILQDSLALVQAQARLGSVEISSVCPEGLPPVSVDTDDMKQVFVNLVNNAFVSMPQGGRLTIRCRHDQDITGGDVVAVEFSDTGIGIPEAQQEKIFDPFFSIGADGDGMGLGLSISYMIVQNHGGRIEVESAVGTGSVFTVVLPVGEGSPDRS